MHYNILSVSSHYFISQNNGAKHEYLLQTWFAIEIYFYRFLIFKSLFLPFLLHLSKWFALKIKSFWKMISI